MLTLLPLLGLMALFFLWGFFVARARGRSALMWGIACAVTFFIGIAILYSLGKRTQLPSKEERGRNQDLVLLDNRRPENARLARPDPRDTTPEFSRPADVARRPAPIDSGESIEDRRWRYLSEYHPEVRKAVAAVSHLGDGALQELKIAHLSVGDAAVLPAIVQRIGERFGGNSARPFINGAAASNAKAVTSLNQSTDKILSQPATDGFERIRSRAKAQSRVLDNDDEEEPLMLDAPVVVQDPARRPASLNGKRSLSLAAPASEASILAPVSDSLPSLTAEDALVQDDVERHHDTLVASPLAHEDDDTVSDTPPKDEGRRDELRSGDIQADGGGGTARESGAAGGAATATSPTDRTAVAPADLVGARFLETYANVHLFALADGRVFIDRHEARPNVELARNYVDQVAARRSLG